MVTPNGTNGINGFGGFDDERETLLHTALFKQVSSEEARELLPYLQHAEYDKGDFIFREGDTDHRMYLLEEGRVKLTRQSSDKRVQLLSIHAYGEVLGEIPVFDPHGGPRTASAVAMTNGTRVVWLEHDALFDWLDEHPRVAVDMLQVLRTACAATTNAYAIWCSWTFPDDSPKHCSIWHHDSANRSKPA